MQMHIYSEAHKTELAVLRQEVKNEFFHVSIRSPSSAVVAQHRGIHVLETDIQNAVRLSEANIPGDAWKFSFRLCSSLCSPHLKTRAGALKVHSAILNCPEGMRGLIVSEEGKVVGTLLSLSQSEFMKDHPLHPRTDGELSRQGDQVCEDDRS